MVSTLVAVRAAGASEEVIKKIEDVFWVVHLATMKIRAAAKGWKAIEAKVATAMLR